MARWLVPGVLVVLASACTGGGGSSSSSSSSSSTGGSSSSSGGTSSSGGASSGGAASSSSAPGSSSAGGSSGNTGSSSSDVQACFEACGVGCPSPEFWVCGANGQRYCNSCVAGCDGTTVVDCPDGGTPTDGGSPGDAGSCLEQCGVGCPAPEYWVCGADGQRYCNACNAACAGTAVTACTDADGGIPPLPDAGMLPCEGAGGSCVAVTQNACSTGFMTPAWSCGGGVGSTCCMPPSLCPPVCLQAGTSDEGWYNSCTGELLCTSLCGGEFSTCDQAGTRSEGWYTSGQGCGFSSHLIEWADCAP